MVDAGLRVRVERLLRGDFRAEDLTRLFLYARDRCDGRETVQEVGDFVAHHDERTKGLITRTTRDWYVTAEYAALAMNNQRLNKPFDLNKLPADLPSFLRASFRRGFGPDHNRSLREKTGLNRAAAERLLSTIIKNFASNADGTLTITASHTKTEIELIKYLWSYLAVSPAFNGERLFDDFSATLKSHGLIQKSELRAFETLKAAIALYAITVMHNCTIQIRAGVSSQLTAGANQLIEVSAAVPVPMAGISPQGGGQINLASSIYETAFDCENYCEAALLAMPRPWTCDLEVTPNMRLGVLA
jgi:hypothetical protein